MTAAIPPDFRDIFRAESFAHVATLDADGHPHATPVWVDYDDEQGHVLVNTVRGRHKERNVAADPRVALSVLDPQNPYRHVAIRGEVVDVVEDGADAHIDRLTQQYMGFEEYPNRETENGPRVIVRIRPETVSTMHRPEPTPTGFVRYGLRAIQRAVGLG